jgi:hypothetical protein
MTKHMMLKALSEFLAARGVETISLAEYKALGDKAPVKDFLLRRAFGTWTRVLSNMHKRFPAPVKPAPKAAPAPKPTLAPAPKAEAPKPAPKPATKPAPKPPAAKE